MNSERQIIGSLLIDSSRIDDMHLLNSEMFTDPILSKIFSLYEHADGKEVNHLSVIAHIKGDYLTEKNAMELLAELINEHDSGLSDRSSANALFDEYRVRKFDELMSHTKIDTVNIDSMLDDYEAQIQNLRRPNDNSRVKTLRQLSQQYKGDYFKEKDKKHYEFGFSKIDKAIGGVDDGDIVIIAARPAVGKSAFTLQIIRKLARDGIKVGYFNLEMAEKQIYERSIASSSGIDMTRIRLATAFLNDERSKFDKGTEILEEECNLYVISGTQSIIDIRNIQKEYKFDVIAIDYLQLIQSTGKRNSRVSEVGDISRGLKAIATDYKIPVIALSQLNRSSELNKDKEPVMSELRESGDIEQDASVIMMLWNSNPDDPCEKKVKVEKSRNGYTDRETLFFDGKHMTFSTLDIGRTEFNEAVDQEELPWN